MRKIISILVFALTIVSCSVKAANGCLGGEQLEKFKRYECLDTNAFLALSSVEAKSSTHFKVELFKIDDELLLVEGAADFALIFSSFDIGEPAILVGLKTENPLRFGQETNVKKGVYRLENFEREVVFDITFNGYESLEIKSKENRG